MNIVYHTYPLVWGKGLCQMDMQSGGLVVGGIRRLVDIQFSKGKQRKVEHA
jgi:hypothetical protein